MVIPPIPPWPAIHPLVIHFPVVLLLIAPIFLISALFCRSKSTCLLTVALVLMGLGTIGALVAVETGEAGARLAENTPEISQAIQIHAHWASLTRLVFSIVTGIFLVVFVTSRFIKKEISTSFRNLALVVFILIYLASLSFLVETAYYGGLLVHHHGVHALL